MLSPLKTEVQWITPKKHNLYKLYYEKGSQTMKMGNWTRSLFGGLRENVA
jgi:hypothetical protein